MLNAYDLQRIHIDQVMVINISKEVFKLFFSEDLN